MKIEERILSRVKRIEGVRDGYLAYESLVDRAHYIESEFNAAGFRTFRHEFVFDGKTHWNIVAEPPDARHQEPAVLVGAHYDAVMGSPGADDNASGIAVMLEAAQQLGPFGDVQFAAFTLEEPQPNTLSFLIGSKRFVASMKNQKRRYRAVMILESVGFVSTAPGSQHLPPFVNAPRTGDFIGIVASGRSRWLLKMLMEAAAAHAPGLKTASYVAPLRGYITPEARFSDHAPFWDAGFPAVMITDTAMFRNPHYHRASDTSDTLSAPFMAQVALMVIHTARRLLERQ